VINRKGLVFIGRRIDGPEHVDRTHVWQMPQGGIDDGEKPYPAALRELYEETSIRSVERLGAIRAWLTYDIPQAIGQNAWKGRYRGQKQKWYALRFTGRDSEINVENPGDGHDPEFIDWRWEPMENLPDPSSRSNGTPMRRSCVTSASSSRLKHNPSRGLKGSLSKRQCAPTGRTGRTNPQCIAVP
jgi:putative (di)nucleoside polyphosphate hydrolase